MLERVERKVKYSSRPFKEREEERREGKKKQKAGGTRVQGRDRISLRSEHELICTFFVHVFASKEEPG